MSSVAATTSEALEFVSLQRPDLPGGAHKSLRLRSVGLLVRTASDRLFQHSHLAHWLPHRRVRPLVVAAAPECLGGATRMSNVALSTPLSVHSLPHNHKRFRIVIGPTHTLDHFPVPPLFGRSARDSKSMGYIWLMFSPQQ